MTILSSNPTGKDGYCPIQIATFHQRAWYSIAKEIAHGENRVGILVRSGQLFFKRLIASFQRQVKAFTGTVILTNLGRHGLAIGLILCLSCTIAPLAHAESKLAPPSVPSPSTTPVPIEPTLGSKVFTANCAACHIGGNNVILAEKNLSKDALAKYAMDSIAAIKTQVTGGKNAMPAFGDNLTSAEIEAVARYVLTQSQQDWKGSSVGLQ